MRRVSFICYRAEIFPHPWSDRRMLISYQTNGVCCWGLFVSRCYFTGSICSSQLTGPTPLKSGPMKVQTCFYFLIVVYICIYILYPKLKWNNVCCRFSRLLTIRRLRALLDLCFGWISFLAQVWGFLRAMEACLGCTGTAHQETAWPGAVEVTLSLWCGPCLRPTVSSGPSLPRIPCVPRCTTILIRSYQDALLLNSFLANLFLKTILMMSFYLTFHTSLH